MGNTGTTEEMTFRELFQRISRKKRAIFTFTFLALLIAILWSTFGVKRYESAFIIEIGRKPVAALFENKRDFLRNPFALTESLSLKYGYELGKRAYISNTKNSKLAPNVVTVDVIGNSADASKELADKIVSRILAEDNANYSSIKSFIGAHLQKVDSLLQKGQSEIDAVNGVKVSKMNSETGEFLVERLRARLEAAKIQSEKFKLQLNSNELLGQPTKVILPVRRGKLVSPKLWIDICAALVLSVVFALFIPFFSK